MLGQAKNIILIQIYVPTSATKEEKIKEFYSEIQKNWQHQ